jgi:hypothetical protein
MYRLSGNYSRKCILLAALGLMIASPAKAEEKIDEGRWLFSQDSQSFKSSFFKTTLRDNRLINTLRATKDAVNIDFKKEQPEYFGYDFKDTSVEDDIIKINMKFHFH